MTATGAIPPFPVESQGPLHLLHPHITDRGEAAE